MKYQSFVPTIAALIISIVGGVRMNAGDRLKEIGTSHWEGTNEFGNNLSGFTAIPAGMASPYNGNMVFLISEVMRFGGVPLKEMPKMHIIIM